MRQRINIAVAVEMDADDLARVSTDEIGAMLVVAMSHAALGVIPRSIEASIASTRVNVSPPYTPKTIS